MDLICKPNDWTRSVTKAAKDAADGKLSATAELQLEYWTGLRDVMESRGGPINAKKPYPQAFAEFSLGKSGVWMCTSINDYVDDNDA